MEELDRLRRGTYAAWEEEGVEEEAEEEEAEWQQSRHTIRRFQKERAWRVNGQESSYFPDNDGNNQNETIAEHEFCFQNKQSNGQQGQQVQQVPKHDEDMELLK